ncbi:alpha/beta fold hydrolase [Arthrobacter sedimenti]|uniref:alpha/beta fold hydrolase n=1 Tax=Arthrobacter sedimenti TaxID=2694931 RepID=UPI000B35457F|nr:alpha/beta fold hydrolase [Arthrobacter sedimenti]OUM39615.1 hydrolase [Arthrobacter agilis]
MVALPGVDPSWSTYIDVPSSSAADAPGTSHRWHYLDNGLGRDGTGSAKGTLLCVHGNPTWSYLWRSYLAAGLEAGWRVIAVDQLDMGYSERTGAFRRLEHRITDLEDFVGAVGLPGPVVTVGHDWGGVVSLGYANRNRDDLAGVILTNTAIHQNPDRPIPAPLRLALAPGVHGLGTRTSTAFLDVTLSLARPALDRDVRRAFRDPYRTAAARQGIANFVSDIPADASHPSYGALTTTAEGIRSLDVPVLMMWGPHDPIFSDPYLEDLARRMPHADIHRFERAGHLVQEDADTASTAMEWLGIRSIGVAGSETVRDSARQDVQQDPRRSFQQDTAYLPLGARIPELAAGSAGTTTAVAELTAAGTRTLSWRELDDDIRAVAGGLTALGVGAGSRVSLLVPPGVDLTVLIYACLRIGAVIVVADAGLGARGLSRAVKGSAPDVVIGIERALLAARAFGWPGRRISVAPLSPARRTALRVEASLNDLRAARPTDPPAAAPDADADAAILFTSGSTGPAKGVVYTHRQLSAMRDAVETTLGLGPGAALVAGFAPFALLGPALGATSVTPDMDVTAPGTLTAQALADAAAAIDATVVFASPAALRNVLATSADVTAPGRAALGRISLLLSAGAPVPVPLLDALQDLVPSAVLHTPYGMTESLLVADIDLTGIHAAAAASGLEGAGNGVCVGRPVPGARAAVSPLDGTGAATGEPTTAPGVTGEILVDAPHVKDRYFRLWRTQQESSRTPPWHRTGDVGHFDAEGRLWVEGRLGHVVTAAGGVLTPVGLEQALEELDGVHLAAVVGVGPVGTQAVVAVLQTETAGRRPRLADPPLAAAARAAARDRGVDLAAILAVPALPVDIRHNAKIDRTRVAAWSSRFLSGGRAGSL